MFLINDSKDTLGYKLSNKKLAGRVDLIRARYEINLVPADDLPMSENRPLLRITKNQLRIEHQKCNLFFHPSMALLRMITIKRGITDRFLRAAGLAEGDTFLDATMGLASDSLIASWAVGKTGKIISIEGSSIIHLLVSEGLNSLEQLKPVRVSSQEKEEAWQELAEASSRVQTICADHLAVLKQLPDASVDIIYFDPMFRDTFADSSSIKPLKDLSIPEPLGIETIKEACRVARRRIVLKERNNSGEFARLGFKVINGGKYSSISFGIIDLAKTGGHTDCSL